MAKLIRRVRCLIGRHDYRYQRYQVSGAAFCSRCDKIRPVHEHEDIRQFLK